MDVQIEPQIRLLSRLQLAIGSKSSLCFLHGDSGVGKSYLVNAFAEQAAQSLCIKLSYRKGTDLTQFTQQIICELATDEFLDLNQPLLNAIQQHMANHNQPITLIVDNASDLPQPILGMLWHSVNDYARKQGAGPNFSVIVIGESNWALPLFSALDKKENSLVGEFQLNPLDKEQARDFMMTVHSQWSDHRIEQFLKTLKPKYRLPKQLIYAQSDFNDNTGKKRLLWLLSSVLLISFIGLAAAVYFLPFSESPQTADIDVMPSLVVSQDKPDESIQQDQMTSSEPAPDLPESLIEQQPSVEESQPVVIEQVARQQKSLAVDEPPVKNKTVPAIELPQTDVIEVDDEQKQIIEAVELASQVATEPTWPFDEATLLSVPSSSYSLMLGGYSSEQLLTKIFDSLSNATDIYQYKTIRNGKAWYVLLYGSFETQAAANQVRFALPEYLSEFTPWPKPFTTIHQEITALAAPTIENNLNNE